ncbi:MAG: hypothetical protein PHG84_02670 [Endomicrobiaceae bacterium]|nr:hypothetical protein [Endomicrobiaceae bacterium]MDD3053293.1 hypothetical protein [Endomicrobiaceae bacterium]MDD3922841.1 hypothetical protein [Endomicrobiaceae bacterium]
MTDPISAVSTMTLVMQSVDVSTSAHVMNAMDVLGQVHAFYDSAWSNLMKFLVISVTILGLGIPFLVYFFQNRSIKETEKKIRLQIKEQKEENRTLLEDQKKEFDKQIEKIKLEIQGLDVETEAINTKAKEIEKKLTRTESLIYPEE